MDVAHVAFFTQHVPTEFERDGHYFYSADHAVWHEPASSLDNDAAHEHRRRLSAVGDHGRRLSAVGRKVGRNDRRSSRRLANAGSCCTTATQQGAWI